MSFSTRSVPQPTVAAAPPTPRTFRKSRRLTPGDFDSVLISDDPDAGGECRRKAWARDARGRADRLVVTGAAVVARLPLDVAVDAPAHVERGVLEHLLHLLHLAVAALAGDAG